MVAAGTEIVKLPGVIPLPENRAALAASRRLLRRLFEADSAKPVVPLMLHGPAGAGKSQVVAGLLHAITAHPAGHTARVIAARELPRPTPDDPTGESVAAFDDLVALDFLAVEDVQHLPARTAAAFADLLDRRLARRRVTVVTAAGGPVSLAKLPRRLTSRLAGGLVVAVGTPGRESRRELLTRHAAELRLPLTDEAVEAVLSLTAGQGVRPMLGTVATLATAAAARTRKGSVRDPLSATFVRDMLLIGQPDETDGPMKRLVAKVAAAFQVSVADLLGRSRRRDVLVPRQVAMYLARETTGLSLPRIGAALGGRDHTTILHGWVKVTEAIAADAKLAGTVAELRAALQ